MAVDQCGYDVTRPGFDPVLNDGEVPINDVLSDHRIAADPESERAGGGAYSDGVDIDEHATVVFLRIVIGRSGRDRAVDGDGDDILDVDVPILGCEEAQAASAPGIRGEDAFGAERFEVIERGVWTAEPEMGGDFADAWGEAVMLLAGPDEVQYLLLTDCEVLAHTVQMYSLSALFVNTDNVERSPVVTQFRTMRVITTTSAMQRQAGEWLRSGEKIGLVPTMGYLHQGHLSLVRRARKAVGPNSKVIVSIYVNPTQFGPSEDFSRYPRNFQNDKRLCEGAGVDVIFAPSDKDMYFRGAKAGFSTYVVEETLSCVMEGRSRPTHFRGVTTVVAKLFNIVRPGVAVFGAKDWQQATIVRRMVRDLNFPVRIIVAPTVRESDGLAMSSRNKYLEGSLRLQAKVLSRAIGLARSEVRKGASIPAGKLRRRCQELITAVPAARVDYVEFFDSETLEPVRSVAMGTHMALAVFVGNTRLIDNARL